MNVFPGDNFLLNNVHAEALYHEIACDLPIIDYHCHLSPEDIAIDRKFENITDIWLAGDHYKWRAMRANGVDEKYITGEADPIMKFTKWAETVPFTLRNPLYHWTHLELKRYFGIDKLLNGESARDIYEQCTAQLDAKDFSVRNLLLKMNVEVICTTDDPSDSLEFHKRIAADNFKVRVLPAFRPDKLLQIDDALFFETQIQKLAAAADIAVETFSDLLEALERRINFFHKMGGRLADHGLTRFFGKEFTDAQLDIIFKKALQKTNLSPEEVHMYKSGLLYHLGVMYHEKGWVQQYHIGAFRNINSRMFDELGPDSGFDSMGSFKSGVDMAKFLDRLDRAGKLAKTILYNINPADNAFFATMAGNFTEAGIPGKVQFGAAWWFLDQKEGIERHLNDLSNYGLLSRFTGMLTDSRSFMSFPRHEYFRRIFCNLIGKDIELGLLPDDNELISGLIKNVCYENARSYFEFNL